MSYYHSFRRIGLFVFVSLVAVSNSRCMIEDRLLCKIPLYDKINELSIRREVCKDEKFDLSVLGVLGAFFRQPKTNTPILFVTQVPVPGKDFRTVAMTFANHTTGMTDVPRGGNLMIRFPGGRIRNLTGEAGFGSSDVFQGEKSIAVRDPNVHWSGKKALFSMLIGGSKARFDNATPSASRWQIYEVEGLGEADTAVVRKIPGQPASFNNIYPVYGTGSRIHFISDRPPAGAEALYPALDEYELTPTNTGVWSIDPQTVGGDLKHLHHTPSGAFDLRLDRSGRLIFTVWEHAQQDIFANSDLAAFLSYRQTNGTGIGFDPNSLPAKSRNFFNESAGSGSELVLDSYYNFAGDTVRDLYNGEPFYPPQERPDQWTAGPLHYERSLVKHFITWEMNEDGTEVLTINHLGAHELHYYQPRMIVNDPAITDRTIEVSQANADPNLGEVISKPFEQMMQSSEDPNEPGCYFFTNAHHFDSYGAGQIGRFCAEPGKSANRIYAEHVTHPSTRNPPSDFFPPAGHTGLFRNPVALGSGVLLASHSPPVNTLTDRPQFQIKELERFGEYHVPVVNLTESIPCNVRYFTPDEERSYSGPCWQLSPVEVVPREIPTPRVASLPDIERNVFQNQGISVPFFQDYLKQRNLAMFVVRNVTKRDAADRQQPFNLRVFGTANASTAPDYDPAQGHKLYDLQNFQVFMAELRRGADGRNGRRVLPTQLSRLSNATLRASLLNENGNLAGTPLLNDNGFRIFPDGSIVGIVPADRAISWEALGPVAQGSHPVVKEQVWVSFRPGEIRVCANCHGVNGRDQTGAIGGPVNTPQALVDFLQQWDATH
ncbi:hypothetical protein EHQ12_15360 [Leptospira gomenensis]|uniref:Hydrazine synthase alpha subunit middle domain-containing protein n=1 Tax=Leptospira gomenensis TaxID=2484974 RepID=A0A5F1Z229_9LEPT|nr:hypothetical protein [Leptospira gomenensis]TGK28966.1 hypothetical protein EHQ17_16535 [Leptospira gomenensis]TGK35427.1 hypothetical protein EHQ12_15360 [Leptospira gomenensis]TGK40725.1 hypothetical protein EHQ07_17880 [Leptospira gomenensis]TGK68431.1 hypothetical protein EHQ13_00175 [Leptospira gomenensis]